MREIDNLDEWGYSEGGSTDIYTHDSGTAQIRVHHQPDDTPVYRVTFRFEGGDGIIEVTAYDSERADSWEEVEDTVREFVQFFDERIDERYSITG